MFGYSRGGSEFAGRFIRLLLRQERIPQPALRDADGPNEEDVLRIGGGDPVRDRECLGQRHLRFPGLIQPEVSITHFHQARRDIVLGRGIGGVLSGDLARDLKALLEFHECAIRIPRRQDDVPHAVQADGIVALQGHVVRFSSHHFLHNIQRFLVCPPRLFHAVQFEQRRTQLVERDGQAQLGITIVRFLGHGLTIGLHRLLISLECRGVPSLLHAHVADPLLTDPQVQLCREIGRVFVSQSLSDPERLGEQLFRRLDFPQL